MNDTGELAFWSLATFKHGALHDAMTCIMCAVPVLVSLGLIQRNKAKHILLNVFYRIITYALLVVVLDALA